MKALIFDSGPVISLTMNNLLWTLEPLKDRFQGDFFITRTVYKELVLQPLETKKYKFEAMQILPLIAKGVLKIYQHAALHETTLQLLEKANKCFIAEKRSLQIVHHADMEAVAAAILSGADAIVFDERTTRVLIENPLSLEEHLGRKLHTVIRGDRKSLLEIKARIGGLKVLRSVELIAIAFNLGLLDRYIIEGEEQLIPDLKPKLLEGALWGLKLSGCSVRTDEIEEVMHLLLPDKPL
jgi:hypothetical protein